MNLQPGELLAAILAYTGLAGWLFRAQGVALKARDDLIELKSELEEERKVYETRLQKAEATAVAVERLAASVEHLADKVANELRHFAEKQDLSAKHVTEQLSDIKVAQNDLKITMRQPSRRQTA